MEKFNNRNNFSATVYPGPLNILSSFEVKDGDKTRTAIARYRESWTSR